MTVCANDGATEFTECSVLVIESVRCRPLIPPDGKRGDADDSRGVVSVASCSISADSGNGDVAGPCTISYSGSECAEGIWRWSASPATVRLLRPARTIRLRSREGYGGGGSFGGVLSRISVGVDGGGIDGDSAASVITGRVVVVVGEKGVLW